MKNKILPILLSLLLSICALPLHASDWGFLRDVEVDPQTNYSPYLIYKIAAGQPITYCVDGNVDQRDLAKLEDTATRAIKRWFSYTLGLIDFEGRKEEFADIYPLLSNEIKFQKTDCSAALKRLTFLDSSATQGYPYAAEIEDMRLIMLDDKTFDRHMDRVAGGVMRRGEAGVTPSIVAIRQSKTKNQQDLYYVVAHEMGHMLGLSDQYRTGRDNTDPAYGTSTMRPALMSYAQNLNCDDADGLINLIDCKVNKTKRGGEKGWKTICSDQDLFYRNCSEVNRTPFVTTLDAVDYTKLRVTEYKPDGSIAASNTYDARGKRLAYSPIDVLLKGQIKDVKYNKEKQIVFMEDESGIKTNFSYFPDSLVEAVSYNPKSPDTRAAVAVINLVPGADKSFTVKYMDASNVENSVNIKPSDKSYYTAALRKPGLNASRALIYKKTGDETLITACMGKNSDYCMQGNPGVAYYYEDNTGASLACFINRRTSVACINGDGSTAIDKNSKGYAAISGAVSGTLLNLDQLLEKATLPQEEALLKEYLQAIAQIRGYANFVFAIFDSEPVKNDNLKKDLQQSLKSPRFTTGTNFYR